MTTYGKIQDRIAGELGRSDLTTAIQDAIQTAIKYYERRRFYFNETQGSFSASSSQEYYGSADAAFIPKLVLIDSLTITANGTSYPLYARDWAYIDRLQTNSGYTGDPVDYAYYNNKLRFYPVPYTGRTFNISYVQRLATLSATADTNAWVDDAEELIRSRAKRELYTHKIQSTEKAAVMRAAEDDALEVLEGETLSRLSGSLKATQF
jgi:hypothetical protein